MATLDSHIIQASGRIRRGPQDNAVIVDVIMNDREAYIERLTNDLLAGKKPKPLKKGHKGKPLTKHERREGGVCTACRKPLRQMDGRTWHKIGTFKKGEECPSGTPRTEKEELNFYHYILSTGAGHATAFYDVPVKVSHWDHEVDVPDYCYIDKELIYG